MKKILISLILLTLIINPVSTFAYGENTSYEENTSNVRSTIKEKIQTKIENVKTKVAERIENRVENRQERRDERTERHAERLEERFGNYYERLSQIILKIETRLNEIKNGGKDVSGAESKLGEAKTKLDTAKSLSEEAVELFNSIVADNYESQKELIMSARNKADEARKAFLEVHKLIKEAVRLLKSTK